MAIVFVSYRRADAAVSADRLRQRLVDEFGEGAVFFDRDTLPLGMDWRDGIREVLSDCKAVVVVIGPDWLGVADGRTRLNDPDDWVRFEVEQSLLRGIPTIPVLTGGAQSLPPESHLPEPLRPLAFRQLIDLNAWEEADLTRLVEAIRDAARQSWTAELLGPLPTCDITILVRLTYAEHVLHLNFVDAAGKHLFHRRDGEFLTSLRPSDFRLADGGVELPAQLWFRAPSEQVSALRLLIDGRLLLAEGAWPDWVAPPPGRVSHS